MRFVLLLAMIFSFLASAKIPSEVASHIFAGNAFNVLDLKTFLPDAAKTFRSRMYNSEILRILERHPYWETIPFSSIKLPGGIDALTPKQFKKWKLISKSGGPSNLEETTQLSFKFDETSQAVLWSSEQIDLSGAIDLTPYYFEGMFEKKPDRTVRVIDEDRFEIISIESGVHVIFVPASLVTGNLFKAKFENIGAWTAPLGQFKEVTQALLYLTKNDIAYIHHDLDKTKLITVDESFPKVFIPSIQRSADNWNRAFGKNFFRREVEIKAIDVSDCLSSNRLCFNWKGPAAIPWTGIGGSTMASYDPDSGEVLGGLVTFTNGVDESKLQTTPGNYDREFVSAKFDKDWVASVYLQMETFLNYRHPLPELAVQTILLHEIGHFNGMSHNFLGSNSGDVQFPSESIMDYLPFPAIRNIGLGKFDHQLLDAVYRGIRPDRNYHWCSDYEKDGSPGYKAKLANCNPFDLGDSADWYRLLAEKSKYGVLTKIPLNSNLSFLYYLGEFLTPNGGATVEQNFRVKTYLCSKNEILDQILKQLSDVNKVTLICK
jgi:hypothetical protein